MYNSLSPHPGVDSSEVISLGERVELHNHFCVFARLKQAWNQAHQTCPLARRGCLQSARFVLERHNVGLEPVRECNNLRGDRRERKQLLLDSVRGTYRIAPSSD